MRTKVIALQKGGVNRSQMVRDYLAQNPGASPSGIQEALKAKGVGISISLANAVKYAKKRPGKRVATSVGTPRRFETSGFLRAEDLVEAKKFVDRVGGTSAARKALDLLAQLSGKA